MEPIKFPEVNHTFTRPENMTEEQCFDLPVRAGRRDDGFPEIVSRLKLSPEELEHIKETGCIWLGVVSAGIPPMWLSVYEPKMPVMPEQTQGRIIGINGDTIAKN